jgi:glycosyltransferase involved in cell wall biosynthesis
MSSFFKEHPARNKKPLNLSVVIPIHNGGEDLQRCLKALKTSTRPPDEMIVIDDASTDTSASLAYSFGAIVLFQKGYPLGPAKARNRGAAVAEGDILVFIDADVMVHLDTLALIEQTMVEHPEISALFGSYDDAPPHRSLVSLYKNLQHHFVHHHSQREASTFDRFGRYSTRCLYPYGRF